MVSLQRRAEFLRLVAIKFGQNSREGDLRDDLLLVRVGEQWRGGKVKGEEEERRRDLLYIYPSASVWVG